MSFSIGYIKCPSHEYLEARDISDSSVVLGNLEYDPFRLHKVQMYNPIYNLYFTMNEVNYNKIQLNHRYHFVNMNTLYDNQTKTNIHTDSIFIKFAPLIDPIRYLNGKIDSASEEIRLLPTYEEKPYKLWDSNNASYVDNFFCYLSGQLLQHHNFVHGLQYYGSFLAIQEKFRMNVADDLSYLMQHEYFRKNKGILYEIEEIEDPFSNFGSRNNKQKLAMEDADDIVLEDVQELTVEPVEIVETIAPLDNVLDSMDNMNDKGISCEIADESSGDEGSEIDYSSSESQISNDKKKEEDDESESESKCEDESESDCEMDSHLAYIYNYPTQMICLEKCEGTLDDLFMSEEMDEKLANDMLAQIIFILITYQKAFHFTHNDLHTNNIMWVKTEIQYLYYRFNKKVYRVPTNGRIFKIIDFGRSIYKFKGKTLCSNSFAPEGDAATQYNFGPYYNPDKPILEPNYSFDLCRLATSIYDFVLDECDDIKQTNKNGDSFQKVIHKWVMDDNKNNVLYKRNGEERYPGFKLYKMIARTVHGATPEDQLKNAPFNSYLWKSKGSQSLSDRDVFDIDALPDYTV